MVMFGKPGAGKGTLASRLVNKYEIMSLSTGDILRQNISEGTEVGQLAEGIVSRGGLIPDDIMLKVVTSKLDSLHNKHWILDGFPRTLGQGKMLNEHLRSQLIPLTLIVNLDVADEIILNRISERYVHLPSGRVYNSSFNRPKVDGLDDVTGEPLTKRPDDNPETFSRRLEQFYASTSPLLSFYASDPATNTKLVTLKGETSDQIWPQLDAVVRQSFPALAERPESRKRSSLSDAVLARGERSDKNPQAGVKLDLSQS
jgi:adenylate kinase